NALDAELRLVDGTASIVGVALEEVFRLELDEAVDARMRVPGNESGELVDLEVRLVALVPREREVSVTPDGEARVTGAKTATGTVFERTDRRRLREERRLVGGARPVRLRERR